MFVVFGILALLLVYFIKKHYRQLQLSSKLSGPPGWPLIGNGIDLVNKSPIEFIKIISGFIDAYGKFFRLWLGNQLVFIMNDPKDIECVLTNMNLITKSSEYDYLMPWLNTGLLTSTGSKWVNRRKIITHAFHFKILEDFVEIFDRQSSILVEKLRPHVDKCAFNIFPITATCSLDIICESAMGISLNAQNDIDSEYVKNVNALADIIHQRTYDFIQRYDTLFMFTSTYRKQNQLIRALHDFSDKVIVARRKKLLNETKSPDSDGEGRKKLALLDLLLQASIEGKTLTNDDIREEIDTFMFEGHDTTNSAIAFTLFNIAKYKDVQKKCIAEIQTVIGSDLNAPVDMKTLNELKYLELVCKESLRLYPSVPLFGRKVCEETVINGKLIPKDSSLIITPYFMGRDPEIFANPLEFIPERFDVETTADKVSPFAYIPFSAGSRNCIGQKFALLEVKSVVSKLLRNYELITEDGFEPQDSLDLVIKSKNGVCLKITHRK